MLIGLIVVPLPGCKKYSNDPFFSTYSPEARLTKGDGCVWTCVKYFSASGIASDVPPFHYSLSLNKDKSGIVGFSWGNLAQSIDTLFEISKSQEWALNNSKEKLSFFGDYNIKKLTMNQLELVDAFGNIYLFEKRKTQVISSLNEGIKNIPLFGLFDETVILKDFNSCEFLGNVQAFDGSAPLGLVEGIFGNGIGGNGGSVGTIKNYTFSFTHYFEKPGYITIWILNYGIGPTVKVNGTALSSIDYLVGGSSPGQGLSWCNIKIRIDSPGNKTVSISKNTATQSGAVQAIDEIRYWQIQ